MKTRRKLRWLIVTVIALTGLLPSARAFYAPAEQRWLNRDPISEMGFELLHAHKRSALVSADGNLFRMVLNDPANQVDPYGLIRWEFPCSAGHSAACAASCGALGVKSCRGWEEDIEYSNGYQIIIERHWGFDCECGKPLPPPPSKPKPPKPPWGPSYCKRNGPPPIVITGPPPPEPPIVPPNWPPGGGRIWPW